jgi:hypothetical protein
MGDIVPNVKKIGALWDATTGTYQLDAIKAAAKARSIELFIMEFHDDAGLQAALELGLDQEPQAVIQLGSPLIRQAGPRDPMNARRQNQQPVQFHKARQCGSRTKSGKPCRSPATKKGRCRLHGGAKGSGGPPGERNGQYRHGERTKAAIAEQKKFSALLKTLRAGLT